MGGTLGVEGGRVAWLWTDTLADLLETIDRVEPECLRDLRERPVAYRLGDDGDPVSLARGVFRELAGALSPARPAQPAGPGLRRSNRPG
mgnify:FL=1